jgi:peptide chain release factor 1
LKGDIIKVMSREKLLSLTKKDFKIETYRASGKGGQNRNKTSTAVRITHPPSGACAHAEDERVMPQNLKLAFQRLIKTKKFQDWLKIESARKMGKIAEIEQEVDKSMNPQNLKIEGVDENGRWEDINKIAE